MKSLIAIDPGSQGGVAFWRPSAGAAAFRMPETQGETLAVLRAFLCECIREECEATAYVEQVGGFIKGNPAPGSAMFSFGEGFGFIKGVIQTLGIRLVMVRPQTWQKHFGLGSKSQCATKSIWKRKLQAEAQRRYPHLEVTMATADALLILDYARSQERVPEDAPAPAQEELAV